MHEVEIIAVGNELLLGDVLDTNSHWLCRQFTGLGGQVRRVVQVRDDPDTIARELREAVERQTEVIVTTGGLGPTDDDRTLAAVALALDRSLREHKGALAIVERRYRELAEQGYVGSARLTPARRKMAHLPEGAEALFNPVGTAPGVVLRYRESLLICLPGVPEELRGIFGGPLSQLLDEVFGACFYTEWAVTTICDDEATLAPMLGIVTAAHPNVYIKSRATPFGARVRLRITLSLAGTHRTQVEAHLKVALDDLRKGLDAIGIPVESVERPTDPDAVP